MQKETCHQSTLLHLFLQSIEPSVEVQQVRLDTVLLLLTMAQSSPVIMLYFAPPLFSPYRMNMDMDVANFCRRGQSPSKNSPHYRIGHSE